MKKRSPMLRTMPLVAMLLLATAVDAQQSGDETATESQPIDEIVVIGNKDGDPIDLDAHYEAQLLKRITQEYMRLQALEEEERWRSTLPQAVKGPARIMWGYDAQAESRMRRDTALTDLPIDNVKPATIISISF